MDGLKAAQMLNAVCKYDESQAKLKSYNRYAFGQYMAALNRIAKYVNAGHDLRDAIIACFLGRLCDKILKAVDLPVMTKDECKFGLPVKLPYLD